MWRIGLKDRIYFGQVFAILARSEKYLYSVDMLKAHVSCVVLCLRIVIDEL